MKNVLEIISYIFIQIGLFTLDQNNEKSYEIHRIFYLRSNLFYYNTKNLRKHNPPDYTRSKNSIFIEGILAVMTTRIEFRTGSTFQKSTTR